MRCDDVKYLLGAHVDGELPAPEAEAVSEHLDGCLACQAERVGIAQLRERMSALPRVKAPAALAAAVAARVAQVPVKHPEDALSAFMDDELTGEERERVGEHITACAPCSQEIVALDDVVSRVRALFWRSAPA